MASAGYPKRNQLLFWEVSLFFLETWGSWEDTVWEGGSAAEDREKPLAGAELKLQLLSPFSGSLCKTLSCLTSCCHVSAARWVNSGGRLWDLSRVCTQTALPLPGHSKYVHTTQTKRQHCERAANRKQIDSTQKHPEAFHIHSPVQTWGIRASYLRLSWQALSSEGPLHDLSKSPLMSYVR